MKKLLAVLLLLMGLLLLSSCGGAAETEQPAVEEAAQEENLNGSAEEPVGEPEGRGATGPTAEASPAAPLEEGTAGSVTWSLQDGVLTISGDGEIPSELFWGDDPAKEETCSRIVRVVIQEGITGIGGSAFSGCSSLTDVEIPGSLTSIGGCAFSGCSSLTDITLPDSLTFIGGSAFSGCSSLNGIEVDPENPCYCSIDGELFSKDGKTLICFPAGSGKAAYRVPDGVTALESYAFSGCSSLTDIALPADIDYIGYQTFEGCSNLNTIYYGGKQGGWDALTRRANDLGAEPREFFFADPSQIFTLKPNERRDFFSVSDDPSFEQLEAQKEEAYDWIRYGPIGEHYGFELDYWSGCSVWCAILSHSTSASASSALRPEAPNISYAPDNIANGLRKNAWVEGAAGDGIGEYVELKKQYTTGSDNPIDFTSLCIVNGYAVNEEIWKMNGRVKQFKLYFNGTYVADLLLEDTIQPQYFSIRALGLWAASGEEFTLRFEIADVYPGSVCKDTAITGIELEFSTPAH